MFMLCKGKGKCLDTCYSATYMSQTRDQQRHRKWQLIGMCVFVCVCMIMFVVYFNRCRRVNKVVYNTSPALSMQHINEMQMPSYCPPLPLMSARRRTCSSTLLLPLLTDGPSRYLVSQLSTSAGLKRNGPGYPWYSTTPFSTIYRRSGRAP